MGSVGPPQNIVIIGGSYVGTKAAEQLAINLSPDYRVLLIEKNSHFQHLFAFPRFAVTTNVNTHKAFIPYGLHTFGNCPPGSGTFIQAGATRLTGSHVCLDRQINLDGTQTDSIPYAFLVVATGTKLTPPSSLPGTDKLDGVAYLQRHAATVLRSERIVIVGGGAVGVQTATDIKQLYPAKTVTLAHSRKNLMNSFDSRFHELVAERCSELGIDTKLGSRVRVPKGGFPTDGRVFEVDFQDGSSVPADFVIICTGQTPQSALMQNLCPQSINEQNFIRVSRTLQIADENYPNIFAIGDVANTGAHKAAKPAYKQVELIARNIQHLVSNEPLEDYSVTDPAAIHLTLGIEKSVIFRDPLPDTNDVVIKWKDDGTLDMGIDGVWTRRGGGLDAML